MSKFYLYELYWDGYRKNAFIVVDLKPELFKRLLDEYRESDPEGYNLFEFLEFLKEKGHEAILIDRENVDASFPF